jgi:tRNA 2-thiouridine synthesizing protein A
MAVKQIDALGLRCPQPILKITTAMPGMDPGDILEVTADCASFEDDVAKWCQRMNKTLLAINHDGDKKIAQIQF